MTLTAKQIDDYADEMLITWDSLKGNAGGFSDTEAKEPIAHLDQADQAIVIDRMQDKYCDTHGLPRWPRPKRN
jgi:hypothetical protein